MKYIYIIFFFLVFNTFSNADCLTGTGKTIEDKVYLPSVTSLIIEVPMNLVLTPSQDESVLVKTNEDILNNLIFNYDNGELVIKGRQDLCPTDLTIYISLKNLNSIVLNSNTKLTSTSTFRTEDFELEINGSSDVNLSIEAEEIEVELDGSGQVILSGTAEEVYISSDGNGSIDAGKLLSEEVSAEQDGNGTIIVNPSKSLHAKLNGNGKILYKNKPKEIEIEKDGNGIIDKTK